MARITLRKKDTVKVDRLFVDSYGIKGDTYYVDSVNGAAGSSGKDPQAPKATIEQAYNLCSANQGDTIVVLPGHVETWSTTTALVLDTAGIEIVGLGRGNSKPVITVDTIATKIVDVTAADIRFTNIRFSANFADITTLFLLAAAPNFSLDGCEFVATATNMNWLTIVTTSAVAQAEDGLVMVNCRVVGVDTSDVNVLTIPEALDGLHFEDNYVKMGVNNGNAIIGVTASKAITNAEIVGNRIYRENTSGDLLIDATGTDHSGIVADNMIGHADTAGEVLIDLDGARMFNNIGTAVTTASGYVLPAIDS